MTPAKESKNLSVESQISEIKAKMEQLRLQFIEDTVVFSKEWMLSKMEEFIISLPEFTSKLNDDQLRSLKVEITKIATNSEPDIRSWLENRSLWWHLEEAFFDKDHYKNLDNFFDMDYRQIIGRVGEVLSKYGYLPKYEMKVFGFQCYKDPTNAYKYFYTDPVFWSNSMKRGMDNYWEEYKYALSIKDSKGDLKTV